jgi:ATP-dependent DNA helicase UvrD/PcrA
MGSVPTMGVATTSGLLVGLTRAQREAVASDEHPLCVLAGAGSGKTTVLTRRVARRVLDGSADAGHVLVATFTRKAAAELRGRLQRLGAPGSVWSGTFHAAAFAQIRRHRADRGLPELALVDDPLSVIREVAPIAEVADRAVAGVVLAEIQWAQSRLLDPEAYEAAAQAAGRRVPVPLESVAEAAALYRDAKHRRRVLDLGDLPVVCADIYEHDPAAAAAIRWRARHLFVDEFQDLNPAQFRLLGLWLGEGHDLFVVGDPRQSVYAWNGADPTLLERIDEILPGTTVLRLDENHRSSPQVVRTARTVLGDDDAPDPLATAPDGPVPTVAGYEDDVVEATALARWLRLAHHPGRAWSHMAVLARTNRRLDEVARALRAAGIPCRRAGSTARGAGSGLVRSLARRPASVPLRTALLDAAEESDAGEDVVGALGLLADEFGTEDPAPTTGAFLTWLAATVGSLPDDAELVEAAGSETVSGRRARSEFDEPEVAPDSAAGGRRARGGAVALSTFHQAKGLEWPVVAIVGLEEGLVPIAYARTPAAIAEEKRLLYVAITRAERELWCSWAASRGHFDPARPCGPSPYLAAIVAAAHVEGVDDAHSRVAELRARLAAAG